MDAWAADATTRNTDRRFSERLPAGRDSTSKSVEWRGVSQIRTAPFSDVVERFGGQGVQPARGHVVLELPVPSGGLEFGEPDAKRGQVVGRESLDRGFNFRDGAHAITRENCIPAVANEQQIQWTGGTSDDGLPACRLPVPLPTLTSHS